MTPGREWDAVALAVAIVGVISGLAIAMALSLSGCAAAGHGAPGDAVGPVADRASWSACDMYLDAPDAGAPSSVTECADQSAIASGYVACCIADGTSAVRPIPGGPFDPCVLPQAPGLKPTPNCIEAPVVWGLTLDDPRWATLNVCGQGGSYDDYSAGYACCCY